MNRSIMHALCLILIAATLLFLHSHADFYLGDPDRYYHLGLSREMVQQHQIFFRTLPSVEGLGWNEYFSDKEFLFHQLTRLGYAIHAEAGTVYAVLGASFLTYATIYMFASTLLSPLQSLLVILSMFGAPILCFRLLLLRPHVLSTLIFVLFLSALLRRKSYQVFIFAALFTLSYHAFYLPFLCLGIAGMAIFTLDKPSSWPRDKKTLLAGIIGIVCGILLNPYFPSNIISAYQIAKIPGLMAGEMQAVNFGSELYPLASNIFLSRFLYPILFLFTGIVLWMHKKNTATKKIYSNEQINFLIILLINGFFLFLSFKSPRSAEYLIPSMGILASYLLYFLQPLQSTSRFVILVLSIFSISTFFTPYQNEMKINDLEAIKSNFQAIAAIPQSAHGAKIFNCEWDRGPYIYYMRPDLRFIDILDPSLLYFKNYPAFQIREELKNGAVPDAYGLLKTAFHADYIFCSNAQIVDQLQTDPDFVQLYPVQGITKPSFYPVPHIFLVKKEESSNYIKTGTISFWKNTTLENFSALTPETVKIEKTITTASNTSSYLNLSRLAKINHIPVGTAHCASFKPSATELARLKNVEILVLGGGRNLRVWRNKKKLYSSEIGFTAAKNTQVVIPLVTKILPTDQIEIVSCSAESANYWGITISLWNKKDFLSLCEEKKNDGPYQLKPMDNSWPFYSRNTTSCLGPIANQKRTL